MELKLNDNEYISLIVDDIEYEITKEFIGFQIRKFDNDEYMKVKNIDSMTILIDGE